MLSGLSPFFNFTALKSNADKDKPPMFAGVPLVNPLLSDAQSNIETLNERISQLESVSQWLNMNLQMVNASVQQLQVQKQTLQALAQWQEVSKDALGELAKINPFKEPSTSPDLTSLTKSKKTNRKKTTPTADTAPPQDQVIPAAFEQVAQSWWDGLQQQFAQLASPLINQESAESNNKTKPTKPSKDSTPKRTTRPQRV